MQPNYADWRGAMPPGSRNRLTGAVHVETGAGLVNHQFAPEGKAVSRFPGKKLPPRWVYVPSRREVRDLVRRSPGDFRRVEFDGTGSGPSSVGLLLGYLERRVADGAWCFYLRLWGAPEAALSDHRDELASAALAAVEGSVAECLAYPPAEVAKPTQLLLWFAVEADGVVPKCNVKPVDRYSFSAGSWWEGPSRGEPGAAPDRRA